MSARRRSRNLPAPLVSSPLIAVLLLAATLLGALALAGCGQMGPLVLPDAASQGTSGSDEDGEEQDEGGAENER